MASQIKDSLKVTLWIFSLKKKKTKTPGKSYFIEEMEEDTKNSTNAYRTGLKPGLFFMTKMVLVKKKKNCHGWQNV